MPDNVITLVCPNGREIAFGSTYVPRKGELIDLQDPEDYERADASMFRVEDVWYTALKDDKLAIRVLLSRPGQ